LDAPPLRSARGLQEHDSWGPRFFVPARRCEAGEGPVDLVVRTSP